MDVGTPGSVGVHRKGRRRDNSTTGRHSNDQLRVYSRADGIGAWARHERAQTDKTRRGRTFGTYKFLEEKLDGNAAVVVQPPDMQSGTIRVATETGVKVLARIGTVDSGYEVSFTDDATKLLNMTAGAISLAFAAGQAKRRKEQQDGVSN